MKSNLSRISLVLLAGALSGTVLAQNTKPAASRAAAPAASTAAAGSGDSKPITVNGTVIPKDRGDALFTEQLSQGVPDSPELRNAIKEEVIRREILAGEARKKGLEKNPILKAQMELAQQAVLIRAYMQDFVRTHPVSDADAQKEYDVDQVAARQQGIQVAPHPGREGRRRQGDRRQAAEGREVRRTGQAVEGSRFEGQGRRPRLERTLCLREALLRRTDQA